VSVELVIETSGESETPIGDSVAGTSSTPLPADDDDDADRSRRCRCRPDPGGAVVNRRAAALARRRQTGAPADRPRQRRCAERAGSPALARGLLHGVDLREQPDPADGTVGFRAYASVTEHPYDMWDMFGPYTETIASTAFDRPSPPTPTSRSCSTTAA
jgi:hypothetical protein